MAVAVLLAGWLAPLAFAQEARIGVLASRGAAEAKALWEPTADYLNQRIRDTNFTIVPLGFEELPVAVARGQVDFFIANSSVYVDLQVRTGANALATLRHRVGDAWSDRFGGVVVTRADNPVLRKLADLKGRSFMAVAENSLGGFHAGWRELRRAGVDPHRDLAALRFGGTHDAVALAVRDRKVDAGTLRSDVLERMARRGLVDLKDFRVLNPVVHTGFPHLCSTELYPEWPIAKVRHTRDDLARRVAMVLITMPPQSEAAMRSQTAGWTAPADYTPVRELMEELGIRPDSPETFTIGTAVRAFWPYLATALAGVLLFIVGVAWHVARLNRRLREAGRALREQHEDLAAKVQARTTELTAILAELEASRRREALAHNDWHDAFDAITDPIFIHDRDGHVVHANPAYLTRAGTSAEAARGRLYWEVFPRLVEPLVSCREFMGGKSGIGVSELRLDTGEVFVSRSFGVQGPDGIRSAIHILEDVTAERRAEAERRMLSRAVAQAGEGVVITHADGLIIYANPVFGRLIGGVSGQVRDTPLRDLFVAVDRKRVEDILPRLTAGGGWTGECSLQSLSGGQVPVFVTASAFREDGGHAGFIFTLMDLRSIKEAEQALTFRLAFESVVGAIAARFVAVNITRFDSEMNAALARIGASVSAEHAYLFRYDAKSGNLSNTNAWSIAGGDSSRIHAMKLTELPWIAERVARFEAIHIPDVNEMPEEAARERAVLAATGARSVLMVPLAAGESVIGLLGFDTAQAPKRWAPEDILLLRAVGEIVASTLRRLDAEAAVRHSEEGLAQAQRVAHLGNWDWDIAANVITWSDEIYRIFGLEPRELGSGFDDFLARVHPDDRTRVQEEAARALRREREFSIDHRIVLPHGGERVVHERAMVVWDDAGTPTRVIGTLQDVTAARHAERELQRLNRALRTLSRGNEILVRASSEPDLLHDICNVLVQVGGYRFAWVGYAEQDAGCTVTPVAHAGHEAGYLQTVRAAGSADHRAGQDPAAIAITTGETFMARDVSSEPETTWRGEALKRGYASVIALPLRTGETIFGALVIDAAEAHAFDDAEVRLLRELADDLTFGIMTLRNRRLREQAEEEALRSERRYHELYDNAPAAYVSVAVADGAILQANAAMVRLLGYSRQELLDMKIFEFQERGAGGLDAQALFEHFRSEQRVRDKEVRMRRRDGRTVWVSLSVEPVRDAEGRLTETRASLLDISSRKRVEEEKAHIAQQLQKALVQTIEAISITTEKRDPYTAGHQTRVAQLAVAIGKELGLDVNRLQGLRLGAQIHDIGKIYVPAEFLNRPGELAEPEVDIIRWHPLMGYDIVKGIDFPWPVAEMVVQHHERLDGSGYPHGLKAEAILLEARIIAVADVAEAMASHRPYRAALPLNAALSELERYKGVRYDLDAAEACLRLFREGHFCWSNEPGHTAQAETMSAADTCRVSA